MKKKIIEKCEWCDNENGYHVCPNCGYKWIRDKVRKFMSGTELQCYCDECLENEIRGNEYGFI